MKATDINGLLILDKPGGVTSRAVVDCVETWFPKRTRIGHAGTLDPLATGILVLCLGEATRLIEYVQRMDKVYRTRLLLGARSDSDDADGVITPAPGAAAAAAATVAECVAAFVGALEQIPPAYSAAKVAGQRAYDLARRGKKVSLSSRLVQVHTIEILDYSYPHLELEVRCGKGTYIRSLARDIGERLGCGALVQTLRRMRIGPFAAEEALTLESGAETAHARLLPMEMAVAELPRLVLPEKERKRLGLGQAIGLAVTTSPKLGEGKAGTEDVAVLDEAGRLAAIAKFDPQRRILRPIKVLQSKKR